MNKQTQKAKELIRTANELMQELDKLDEKAFTPLNAKVFVLVVSGDSEKVEGTLIGSCDIVSQMHFSRALCDMTLQQLKHASRSQDEN
jgi:hypothetical protein